MEPIRGKTEIIDPFYRYKMEKIIFRAEKTKTSIMNLDKIAADLKVPGAECIILFFKKRLAMQMTHGNQGLIISRHVDFKIIHDALYEFIDYFVLCKNCGLPELSYAIRNKQFIADCASCGTSNEIKKNQYTEPVIKFMKSMIPCNVNAESQKLIDQNINDQNIENIKKKFVDGTKKKKKTQNVISDQCTEGKENQDASGQSPGPGPENLNPENLNLEPENPSTVN